MKRKELNTVNAQDYLTPEEAAKSLGIKSAAIRNYLTMGKLTTFKFKTLTLIGRSEVEDWKKHQKKR